MARPVAAESRRLEDYIADRIRVDVATRCWNWTGNKCNGYAVMWPSRLPGQKRKVLKMSRVMFMLVNGALTSEVVIRHKCDNPACVNPDHLEPGSHRDNVNDRISRGRSNYAVGVNSSSAKLNDNLVRDIRAEAIRGEKSIRQIARDYGVSHMCISSIVRFETWRHV